MRICAVIPAAGRGTRLGEGGPKILTPLSPQDTIWSVLYGKISPLVDHIHLVLSPDGAAAFPTLPQTVSVSIQPEPVGMGDAIFRGHDVWSRYDTVLIVWGDQVFVSADTLQRTIAAAPHGGPRVVLPVTRMAEPYVEYVFDGPRLTRILQTREGDATSANGYSDVGTFLLCTDGLAAAWDDYLSGAAPGAGTGEVNFLPFLPFLSGRGWAITAIDVADETEARGINTPADLAFFRRLYKQER